MSAAVDTGDGGGTTSSTIALPGDTNIPPIFALLPILAQTFTLFASVASFVASTTYSVVAFLLTPFSHFLSALFYVFAPFIFLAQVTVGVFITTPYEILVYISQTLYPIYVFFGIACIIGFTMGFGARQVAAVIGGLLLGSRVKKESGRVERVTAMGTRAETAPITSWEASGSAGAPGPPGQRKSSLVSKGRRRASGR